MRDPLYHEDEASRGRMSRDPQIAAAAARLQWMKIATGLIALALVAAIWLVSRWG